MPRPLLSMHARPPAGMASLARLALAAILALWGAAAVAQEAGPGSGPTPDADRALPELPPKRNSAAKLAGLAGFVNLSCEAIRTDKERFTAAIEALGVQTPELEQGELRLRAQAYIDAYRKDVDANCRRAGEMFGQGGTVIPGLFVAR